MVVQNQSWQLYKGTEYMVVRNNRTDDVTLLSKDQGLFDEVLRNDLRPVHEFQAPIMAYKKAWKLSIEQQKCYNGQKYKNRWCQIMGQRPRPLLDRSPSQMTLDESFAFMGNA